MLLHTAASTMTQSLYFRRSAVFAAMLALVVALAGCSRDTPESLTAAGRTALDKRDTKVAIIQLKSALQANGNLPEARYLLGVALLESAEPNGAVVELTKALELKYPADLVVPKLATALVSTGDLRKLITLFDGTTLTDRKAQASLQTSLAVAWFSLGNKTKSEAARAAALSAVPGYGHAVVLNATAQAMTGDASGALVMVDEVLKREPELAIAWQFKGELLASMKDQRSQAVAAFRNALKLDSQSVVAHSALVSMALVDGDLAAAKPLLESMRKALPQGSGQVLFLDAMIALREGNVAKARDASATLLGSFPEHVGVLQLAGVTEGRSGSLMAAESHFAKALQFDPEQIQARRNLGNLYLLLGTPTKALDVLKPAIGADSQDAESLSIAAQAQQQLGNSRAAEALFARAATINPSDETVQTLAALSRLGGMNTDASITELGQLSKRSKGVYADMALLNAHIQRREFEAALATIDTIARKQPENKNVPELRGQLQLLRSDLPAARAAYEAALKANPQSYAAVTALASLDQREGKLADAEKRFADAVKADSRNHLAALALIDLRQRAGATPEEIEKLLQQAVKNSPGEAMPRLRLIDSLMRRKLFADALAQAREAAVAVPGNINVLDALGQAQARSGDLQQAASTYRQMANQDPKSLLPHLRMAELARGRGDFKGAESSLRRALENDPGSEQVQAALVDSAVGDKRLGDALTVARGLKKQFPKKAYGAMMEGQAHARNKDWASAANAFQDALKLEPDHTSAAVRLYGVWAASGKRAEAQAFASSRMKAFPDEQVFEYQVAEEALRRNDFAEAERRLSSMVQRYPRQVLVLNNLASALVEQGKTGGVALAERALAEQPDSPPILDTLASALALDKQYPKALEIQRKAVAAAPEADILRLNLARIAVQAGDKALARTELERLASRGRQFAQQEEVAKLLKTL